jgi:hypothetical protein
VSRFRAKAMPLQMPVEAKVLKYSAARFGGVLRKGTHAKARVHCGTAATAVLSFGSSGDGLTDTLERRHEGRAFIQHGQNRVAGLGRKHQDDAINAGVTVAF